MSDRERLWETARTLARECGRANPLPPLFLFTDPSRTPDPVAAARRLPKGSGVVYRAFGDPQAATIGLALRRVADDRGLTLLIGLDPDLAAACSADGVHLPERAADRIGRLKAEHPSWRVTAAAHGRAVALAAADAGADAVFLSPVFASRSPSAAAPLGVEAFRETAGACRSPVYALGGVTAATALALVGAGACGIAAVDALA
jgi:thiamine-phosphate pyrophosphorylase